MSRELDVLAKEYAKGDVTVLRKDVNLYQRNITTELSGFIKEVERIAKREKRGNISVIAIIH